MNKLWKAIESKRHDCLFIYITHDTQFAAAHQHAIKIWVKNFDGTFWDWEFVNESELPEECLLEILGNRKDVLFVEGEENSYDTQLYREIYKNYHVVPCGGCGKVIESVKATKSNKQLHHLKAYGLIDKDFRTEDEITTLKRNDIHTLKVAEVENLFCVTEVMEIINHQLEFKDQNRIEKAKKFIIDKKFKKQIEQQKVKAIVAEIKHQLTIYNIPENADRAKQAIADISSKINFEKISSGINSIFNEALESADYKKILLVFNAKDISKNIGKFFDIKNYCDMVIRLSKSEKHQELINALTPYLPAEIPIEG